MHRTAASLAIAIALLIGGGCRHLPGWLIGRRPPPCTFNPNATKDEIVAHVNRFATPAGTHPPLTSWRATDVSFSRSGLPPVPGTIAVEAPSRIRIRAAMPLSHSDVADIGANEEEIWIWGHGAKEIVTIRREHVPLALQEMQVPFEPSWLMEVLGVTPINYDDFEIRRPQGEDCRWVDLVSPRDTSTGEQVVRVVRVDLCHGHISEHRIERSDGTLIASAALKDYAPDASGQFEMPHYVRLEWPVTKTALTLRLGPIHANPPALADTAWEVPHLAGMPRRAYTPARYAGPSDGSRQRFREPLYEKKTVHRGQASRMDVFSDEPSGGGQPIGYSPEASQSSSDQPPGERESGPRPFPVRP